MSKNIDIGVFHKDTYLFINSCLICICTYIIFLTISLSIFCYIVSEDCIFFMGFNDNW